MVASKSSGTRKSWPLLKVPIFANVFVSINKSDRAFLGMLKPKYVNPVPYRHCKKQNSCFKKFRD